MSTFENLDKAMEELHRAWMEYKVDMSGRKDMAGRAQAQLWKRFQEAPYRDLAVWLDREATTLLKDGFTLQDLTVMQGKHTTKQ